MEALVSLLSLGSHDSVHGVVSRSLNAAAKLDEAKMSQFGV